MKEPSQIKMLWVNNMNYRCVVELQENNKK